MSQLYKLVICMALIFPLGIGHSVAQTTSISISHPINGKLVFSGNVRGVVSGTLGKQLLLADTFNGSLQTLFEDNIFVVSPVWNLTGDRIAYENGAAPTRIFNLSNNTQVDLAGLGSITNPQDFSPDSARLMYISYFSPSTSPARYELGIKDLNSGSTVVLYSYTVDGVINNVPLPVFPQGVTTVKLSAIRQAAWNPIYPDWIVVQLDGYSKEVEGDQGYGIAIDVTFAQNLQTGQKLSLDQLFSLENSIASTDIDWSPDGNYLLLQTVQHRGDTNILAFNNNNGNGSFNVIDSAPSQERSVKGWLGAGDLFMTIGRDKTTGDNVRYITEIINGIQYSTEFFRLPQSTFERTGESDWYITASNSEKQALTCLFDQAQPTRLAIGTRARVNFTTGIPLHLRSEPTQNGIEILQMPEGTEFDVIGGSACINGDSYYRFWQLHLDDGTSGWAAEADQTDYFIEPIPNSTPTDTFTETPTPTETLTFTPSPTATATNTYTCPCSLWTTSAAPATLDSGNSAPVEVGVKFKSSVAGSISGLRFYKASTNTGTHVGHLWTASGTLLATATFSGESASGWQTVSFSTPVTISADTTYVASYHTTSGHFS